MSSNLGPNFYPKLVQISSELGMKPEDLIAVMISESGMNPSSVNEKTKAGGLIQIMPSTLKGLGFSGTWENFTKLSGEEQLDYIKMFVQNNMKMNGGPFTSAGQYYVANLWPIGLKLPGVRQGDINTPILEENPERTGPNNKYSKKYYDLGLKVNADFESKAYKSNPLFHKSVKGAIVYGDFMKQVEINKSKPEYKKAMAEMKEQTGYQSHKNESTMIAKKDDKPSILNSILDKFLQMIHASEKNNKKLYKKYLPINQAIIKIFSNDYTNSIEFSRILCSVLEEELISRAFTHTDGNIVEVECSIPGSSKECFDIIEQLTLVTAETFKKATSKIGGVDIKFKMITNKKSYKNEISLKTASLQHRKFILKFI